MLTGTQHTVNHVDGAMTEGRTAEGTLRLAQNARLQITGNIWGRSNTGIFLDSGAELNISGKNLSISNRTEKDTASLVATTEVGPGQYTINQSSYEISNAHVTYTGGEASLNNKLTNSAIENAGTGTLQVTHTQNQLSGVIATSGNVEVYNVASGMTLDELRIAAGLNVSLLVGGVDTSVSSGNLATATVEGIAAFDAGSRLNANLTLAAGSTLEMQGTAQLNGTLELVTGADSLTLAGSMYDAICNMQRGDSIILFTGLESLMLNIDGACDSWESGSRVLASEIFGNVPDPQNKNDQYYVTYTCAEVGGGELSFFLAPEPTTTTLSLLALSALAMRRRRAR